MDDLERWLRTAMQEAGQEPPVNLLSGVWRRRRRHVQRMRVGGLAAVAAIAIPSVLHLTAPAATKPTGQTATVKTPPDAAPGSELLKCGDYSDRGISGGQLDAHWKAASIQAGPVWFVFARAGAWRSSQRLPGGRLRDVNGPVLAVKNGTTVEITTPPGDRSRFRFLTRGHVTGTSTLREGVSGLTVVACPYQRVQAGHPRGLRCGADAVLPAARLRHGPVRVLATGDSNAPEVAGAVDGEPAGARPLVQVLTVSGVARRGSRPLRFRRRPARFDPAARRCSRKVMLCEPVPAACGTSEPTRPTYCVPGLMSTHGGSNLVGCGCSSLRVPRQEIALTCEGAAPRISAMVPIVEPIATGYKLLADPAVVR